MSRSPIPVVYVAGWGRSGSTLLEHMLAQVDGFVSVGELRALWKYGYIENTRCSCGAPFLECEFWARVTRRVFGRHDNVDAARMERLCASVDRSRRIPHILLASKQSRFGRNLEEYHEIQDQLYQAIQAESGKEVIVDSSKIPARVFMLSRLKSIRVHVIHLVRDSRGCAFSWQRIKQRFSRSDGTEDYGDVFKPAQSAGYWAVYNSMATLSRHAALSYVRIRYEDLVSSPCETLGHALAALGKRQRDFAFLNDGMLRLNEAAHTVSGNVIRFQRGTVALRPDVEWKAKMKAKDKWLVTSLTLPWLWRYGYSIF